MKRVFGVAGLVLAFLFLVEVFYLGALLVANGNVRLPGGKIEVRVVSPRQDSPRREVNTGTSTSTASPTERERFEMRLKCYGLGKVVDQGTWLYGGSQGQTVDMRLVDECLRSIGETRSR